MYFSSLKSADSCKHYPEAIQKALAFLQDTDLEALAPGDYPIEGDKLFAKVFDLTTLPVEQTHPEVHRHYIDVQYWPVQGEIFGIAPYEGGGVIVEAQEKNDTYFLEAVPNESFITTAPGCFAVFFPWDAHRPGTVLGEQATFRKCVVKVHMDLLQK